jgi:hypothetical protein
MGPGPAAQGGRVGPVLYGVRPGSARDLAAQPSRTRGTWLKAFTSVTLRLAQSVAAERWQALGLSAMLPTLVLTDCVGAAATPGGTDAPPEPLGPAITWEDGLAEGEGNAFRAHSSAIGGSCSRNGTSPRWRARASGDEAVEGIHALDDAETS